MDADFMRELMVLGLFVVLYAFGSALLIRGHKTDLSAIQNPGAARRAAEGSAKTGPVRLNRRRKARLREAMERGEVVAEGQATGDELSGND